MNEKLVDILEEEFQGIQDCLKKRERLVFQQGSLVLLGRDIEIESNQIIASGRKSVAELLAERATARKEESNE